MSQSLFSTYSTGENRVTASILAVLRSLSLPRIERLLGALMEESEFELVQFRNQPSKGAAGVPDAVVASSTRILIETKITYGGLHSKQIDRHLDRLYESSESTQRLLLLTPDDRMPPLLQRYADQPVVWASFASFDQAIDELLGDTSEVISEREAFLLRELQAMFAAEGLIASSKNVVVVPARTAWPEYEKYHVYACQPSRTFRPVEYIAFYTNGCIHPIVPRIIEIHDEVVFERGKHKGHLGKLVDRLLTETVREVGESFKVMMLSGPEDKDTVVLDRPVTNDMRSASGRVTAFTQNQRYVSIDDLRTARVTSELVEG